MKMIIALFILLSLFMICIESRADKLDCVGYNTYYGKLIGYQIKLAAFGFISEGKTILFDFSTCHVTIENK